MMGWIKKLFSQVEPEPDGYRVIDPDGDAVFLQANLYDEWYPISDTTEVLVRSNDPIGRFWIRERKHS